MSESLINKVIKPIISNDYLIIDNFIEKFKDIYKYSIISVTGFPGSGKSSLVSFICNNLNYKWFTLDSDDNIEQNFFKYFFDIMNISTYDTNYKKYIIQILNDYVKSKTHIFIVLDNYEMIINNEISNYINFIINNCPSNLHLIIISNDMKLNNKINLSNLYSQNKILEIDDLYLNISNINDLMKKYSNKISRFNSEDLISLTLGWLTGIKLLLKNNNNKIIFSYFESIFVNLDINIQKDILKLSLFNFFNSELTKLILCGIDFLKYLKQLNLFVIMNEDGNFIFIPVFRQYLNSIRELYLTSNDINNTFLKASAWYESKGQFNEHARCLFLSKHDDKLLKLLNLKADNFILQSQANFCEDLDIMINYLRDKDKKINENLILFMLWFLYDRNKRLVFERELKIFLENYKIDNHSYINYHLIAIKALISYDIGDYEKQIIYSNKCLDSGLKNNYVLYKLNYYMGLYYYSVDKYNQSKDYTHNAIHNLKKSSINRFEEVFLRYNLSLIEIKNLNLDVAENIVNNTITEYFHYFDENKRSYLVFIMNLIEIYDIKNHLELRNIYKEKFNYIIRTISNDCNKYDLMFHFYWRELFSYIKRNQFVEANKVFDDIRELITISDRYEIVNTNHFKIYKIFLDLKNKNDFKSSINFIYEYILFDNYHSIATEICLFILLKLKLYNEIDIVLNKIFQKNSNCNTLIIYYIFRSIMYHKNKKKNRAITCMIDAIKISQKSYVLRPFYNSYIPKEILLYIKNKNIIDIDNKFISNILLINGYSELENMNLTLREKEIIKKLLSDMTNNQIASELFISINTLKTHIRKIYKKLNISNKNDLTILLRNSNFL